MIIQDPAKRKWVYNVLLAAAPLVVFYGLMTEEEILLWIALGGSALGNGLARVNVNEE